MALFFLQIFRKQLKTKVGIQNELLWTQQPKSFQSVCSRVVLISSIIPSQTIPRSIFSFVEAIFGFKKSFKARWLDIRQGLSYNRPKELLAIYSGKLWSLCCHSSPSSNRTPKNYFNDVIVYITGNHAMVFESHVNRTCYHIKYTKNTIMPNYRVICIFLQTFSRNPSRQKNFLLQQKTLSLTPH